MLKLTQNSFDESHAGFNDYEIQPWCTRL